MDLIIKIKDVASIAAMSTGDKVLAGLMVALIGMAFTFLLLILLWFFITVLSKLTMEKPVKNAAVEKPVISELEHQSVNEDMDKQLVAVIAAAISEFTGDSTESFRIKSIKRETTVSPAWINRKYQKISR